MDLKLITNGAKAIFSKSKFWVKKNSPELLIAGAIVGGATAIFLACKATAKLDDVVKPANKQISDIHKKMNDDNAIANGEYSVKDGRKELMKVYAKTGWKLVKLYSPAFLAFALSSGAMIGSNNIRKGREATMAAAYSAVAAGYSAYRDRVKKFVGDEAEDKLFRNINEKITKTVDVTDPETGEVKQKPISGIISKGPYTGCDYGIRFDSAFEAWEHNGRLNLEWLMYQERYLNQKLKAEGYLFLADVYKALGVHKEWLPEWILQASHVVGWIYDKNDTTHGDNYISFGLTDRDGHMTRDAIELHNGSENEIYLSFNPDGDILTGNNGKRTFMQFAKH